jgi:hypothetical protein
MDPLLLGLKLYEPKTFLFLDNYLTSLQLQTKQSAIAVVCAGAFLMLLGLIFRRVSAAITLASVLWTVGGIIAMASHTSFAAITLVAGAVGLLVGAFLPRLAHALVASVLMGLICRAILVFIEAELGLYGALGGAAAGFLVAILAWESWVALATSALGAVMIAFSLPGIFGARVSWFSVAEREAYASLYGGLATLLFLIGLVVQLRTGEVTWARARQWRLFRFLQKKPKKKEALIKK